MNYVRGTSGETPVNTIYQRKMDNCPLFVSARLSSQAPILLQNWKHVYSLNKTSKYFKCFFLICYDFNSSREPCRKPWISYITCSMMILFLFFVCTPHLFMRLKVLLFINRFQCSLITIFQIVNAAFVFLCLCFDCISFYTYNMIYLLNAICNLSTNSGFNFTAKWFNVIGHVLNNHFLFVGVHQLGQSLPRKSEIEETSHELGRRLPRWTAASRCRRGCDSGQGDRFDKKTKNPTANGKSMQSHFACNSIYRWHGRTLNNLKCAEACPGVVNNVQRQLNLIGAGVN